MRPVPLQRRLQPCNCLRLAPAKKEKEQGEAAHSAAAGWDLASKKEECLLRRSSGSEDNWLALEEYALDAECSCGASAAAVATLFAVDKRLAISLRQLQQLKARGGSLEDLACSFVSPGGLPSLCCRHAW